MIGHESIDVRHIGIVAGTSEGAALCYRTICREAERFLSPHAHPEITMHTFSLGTYLELIEAGRWQEVANLLSQSSEKLTRAGADFIVCPNNTLHRVFDEVQSPIPWLHIADVVASEAFKQGSRRVGLLGTRSVMNGDVYQSRFERLRIDMVWPDAQDQARIHDIILTELIPGSVSEASRRECLAIIERLRERGCDAAILGCTELPLLVVSGTPVLPLLDSTRLLAQAAIRHAIRPGVQSEFSRRLASNRQDWGAPCADKNKEGVFTE